MIGDEVKRYREHAHLTQQRLGLMLGFPPSTARLSVSQWEQNRSPVPLKHFRKLHEIIGIPYEKLIP